MSRLDKGCPHLLKPTVSPDVLAAASKSALWLQDKMSEENQENQSSSKQCPTSSRMGHQSILIQAYKSLAWEEQLCSLRQPRALRSITSLDGATARKELHLVFTLRWRRPCTKSRAVLETCSCNHSQPTFERQRQNELHTYVHICSRKCAFVDAERVATCRTAREHVRTHGRLREWRRLRARRRVRRLRERLWPHERATALQHAPVADGAGHVDKRRRAGEHLEGEHAEAPEVNLETVAAATQHFRRKVLRGAADREGAARREHLHRIARACRRPRPNSRA
eukprot:6177110-Pleurochrysis_carterae.AAC.5